MGDRNGPLSLEEENFFDSWTTLNMSHLFHLDQCYTCNAPAEFKYLTLK